MRHLGRLVLSSAQCLSGQISIVLTHGQFGEAARLSDMRWARLGNGSQLGEVLGDQPSTQLSKVIGHDNLGIWYSRATILVKLDDVLPNFWYRRPGVRLSGLMN